jgi:hypothetical protein
LYVWDNLVVFIMVDNLNILFYTNSYRLKWDFIKTSNQHSRFGGSTIHIRPFNHTSLNITKFVNLLQLTKFNLMFQWMEIELWSRMHLTPLKTYGGFVKAC